MLDEAQVHRLCVYLKGTLRNRRTGMKQQYKHRCMSGRFLTQQCFHEITNGWGWKRLVEAIWSIPLAQVGSPWAGSARLRRDVFSLSPKREIPQPPGAANLWYCSVSLTIKKCFLVFWVNLLCISLCPLPLSCYWTPLRRIWLHLLYTLHSDTNFQLVSALDGLWLHDCISACSGSISVFLPGCLFLLMRFVYFLFVFVWVLPGSPC